MPGTPSSGTVAIVAGAVVGVVGPTSVVGAAVAGALDVSTVVVAVVVATASVVATVASVVVAVGSVVAAPSLQPTAASTRTPIVAARTITADLSTRCGWWRIGGSYRAGSLVGTRGFADGMLAP
jgi:hypothetical protein